MARAAKAPAYVICRRVVSGEPSGAVISAKKLGRLEAF